MTKKPSDNKHSSSSDPPEAAQLKSNLKKQKNIGADATDNSTNNDKMSNSVADNKKVHFNKFATVQMMGQNCKDYANMFCMRKVPLFESKIYKSCDNILEIQKCSIVDLFLTMSCGAD